MNSLFVDTVTPTSHNISCHTPSEKVSESDLQQDVFCFCVEMGESERGMCLGKRYLDTSFAMPLGFLDFSLPATVCDELCFLACCLQSCWACCRVQIDICCFTQGNTMLISTLWTSDGPTGAVMRSPASEDVPFRAVLNHWTYFVRTLRKQPKERLNIVPSKASIPTTHTTRFYDTRRECVFSAVFSHNLDIPHKKRQTGKCHFLLSNFLHQRS